MSSSAMRKNRKGAGLTKKMMAEKMDQMAALISAMEQALTEWEIWMRMFPQMKKGNTQEEFDHFLADGPIFSSLTEKLMESIRIQVPSFEPLTEEEKAKQDAPAILDGSGNIIEKENPSSIITPDDSVNLSGNENG